jgi:hypothetical protein
VSDFRCSALSAALQEPIFGTASIVHAWLLIEQPGSWGPDAPLESRLPARLAREVVARAERHHVRVLLLRRPDRARVSERRCFVVHSRRPSPWIEQRVLDDPEELLAIDYAALDRGRRFGFGAEWHAPLFLVCTNGRHDPCCAQLGRTVVRELAPARPETVWESSHLGGERFAGNMICFPHGLYFGRLDPPAAAMIIADYEREIIALDHYRGRAGDAFVVQAAEFFLRRDEDLRGVDDVAPMARTRLSDGLVGVEFTVKDGRRFEVHVAVCPAAAPRPLTCAGSPQRPPTFTLVDLFRRDTTGPAVH